MNKKTYLTVGLGALAILAALAFALFRPFGDAPSPEDAGTSGSENEGGTSDSGYTIERVPDEEGNLDLVAPVLERPLVKPVAMDDAVFAQVKSNIAETVVVLEDGDNFNAWLNLASLRTIVEDYRGSEEILIYLTKRYSPAWQVHANLGALYVAYLDNIDGAITNYQQAIALLPNNPALYRALYEAYMKKGAPNEAVATLKEGIANEPRAIDLYVLLARSLRDSGGSESARVYYTQAIEQAERAGNAIAKDELEAERALLPQ